MVEHSKARLGSINPSIHRHRISHKTDVLQAASINSLLPYLSSRLVMPFILKAKSLLFNAPHRISRHIVSSTSPSTQCCHHKTDLVPYSTTAMLYPWVPPPRKSAPKTLLLSALARSSHPHLLPLFSPCFLLHSYFHFHRSQLRPLPLQSSSSSHPRFIVTRTRSYPPPNLERTRTEKGNRGSISYKETNGATPFSHIPGLLLHKTAHSNNNSSNNSNSTP